MRLPKIITISSFVCIFGGLAAFVQAAYHVRAHRYVEYGMFRLAAEALRTAANEWLFISFSACIGIVLFHGSAIVLSRVVTVRLRDLKTANIFGTVILCFGIALMCWGLDHFVFTPQNFHIRWRAVLVVIIATGSFVPGMLVLWRGWRPVLSSRMAAPILVIGFLYVFSVAALNGAMYFGQKGETNAQKPNVIVIVIDCLRARDLGYWGSSLNASPALDRLAMQGVVFKNAYSNAPWTKPSVATLFTSQYPNTHGVVGFRDALSDRWLTIAEVLKNNAYHTCFFNGGNHNFAQPMNFHQGFDYFDSSIARKDASVLTDEFLSYLAKPFSQPFFAYIHYMDAHQPYKKNKFTNSFISDNNILFDPATESTGIELTVSSVIVRKLYLAGKLSPDDQQYLKGLYNSQIRYIDENVQRIISYLESAHLYDDTIIIITADHGEEFFEHHNYEHGHTLYNELLHVPLILTGGRFEHKTVQKTVQLIDVMPTVLDLLQIAISNGYCQGVSLYNTIAAGDAVPEGGKVYATGTLYFDKKFTAICGDKKVIFNTGDTSNQNPMIGHASAERFEFYNLLHDPLEQEPLTEDADAEFSKIKEMLLRFSTAASPDARQKATVDKSLEEQLKSLGYVQ